MIRSFQFVQPGPMEAGCDQEMTIVIRIAIQDGNHPLPVVHDVALPVPGISNSLAEKTLGGGTRQKRKVLG